MESKEGGIIDNAKPRSVKPLIIVLLFSAFFIPLSVFAVLYITEIRTKAQLTEKPEKIELTNITDTSAVISWVTESMQTIGYVHYGNSASLTNTAFDIRDENKAGGEYYLHYVELKGLSPSSLYYYSIFVGAKEYKKNGSELYEFKTGSTVSSLSTPLPIKGAVEDSSAGSENIIIYLYVEKDNIVSSKISTFTANKQYSLDLSNLRLPDLNGVYTDINGASLYILAQGGNRGEGTVATKIVNLSEL